MFENYFPKVIVVLLTGSTLATSGAAGYKLFKSFSGSGSPNPTAVSVTAPSSPPPVLAAQTSSQPAAGSNPLISKPSSTPPVSSASSPASLASKTVSASNPAVNTSNLCLITLFGLTYDVAPLRSTHSGGDVFKCGTDMTAVYQSQHGTNVSRMQPYLYQPGTGSSTGSSSSPNPTPSPIPPPSSPNSNIDNSDEYHEIEDEQDEDQEETRQEETRQDD